MKMFRKDEGFTLVELMVVVLIIGILVAIAVPVFLNASSNAKEKSCFANQRTIEGAISAYNANAASPYAGSLVDGSNALVSGAGTQALKSAPVCPSAAANTFYDTAALSVISDSASSHSANTTFTVGATTHTHY
jgi:prepilin-type N-terminal cleavage/methylation domain-containing protein